jgi:CBS domain-containing protein
MKAKEIMTQKIVSVGKRETVAEAAKKMQRADIGSLPVEDNSQLVGMITDRDIVLRNVAVDRDPHQTRCEEIMTTDIVSVRPDSEIDEVANIMSSQQIKRVPVVEQQKVVGMISLKDISQASAWKNEAGDILNDITETTNRLS